jgi:Tol biopolymer transport system component
MGLMCVGVGCSLSDDSPSSLKQSGTTRQDRVRQPPPPDAELYSIESDGSDLRRLTTTAGVEASLSVSPDGRSVAFYRSPAPDGSGSSNPNAPARLVVASGDGKRQRGLGPVHVVRSDYVMPPAWSPDSRRLAWTEGQQCDSAPTSCATYRVWTVDVRTGERRLVARRAADPAWSPDGRYLAYVRVEWIEDPTDPVGIDDTVVRESLIVAKSDGSDRRVVARAAAAPAWSPRGQLAFVVRGNSITVSAADGSSKRRLGGGYAPVSWSPDGQTLWANVHYLLPRFGYLVAPPRGASDPQGFHVLRTEGGSRRVVRSLGTFGGSISDPWSADGRRTVWPAGSQIAIGTPTGVVTREIELSKQGMTVHSAVWGGAPGSERIFFTASRNGYVTCYRECP